MSRLLGGRPARASRARTSASRPVNPPGLSQATANPSPTSVGMSVLSMSRPKSRYAFSSRRLPIAPSPTLRNPRSAPASWSAS